MLNKAKAQEEVKTLLAAVIIPEEQELADALVSIAKKYGKFNDDDTGVWVGYTPPEQNEKKDIGVKCENCILYAGGTICKIIYDEVEPEGYCRFALIPDGVVTAAGSKSPCWDGYKQVGMKKGKKGNMVPNCVPVNASDNSDSDVEFALTPDGITEKEEEMSLSCPSCVNGCACATGLCDCPPTCPCSCREGKIVVVVSAASRRAPKKDRVKGSKKNKPGSAKGGKKIVFSARVEKSLKNKVKEHNEKAPAGRKATLGQLKAVYRRGAGAFSSSHRPGMARDQWAMARVNAYLKLLKSGRPANPNYKQDNDLLPKAHPKSTNSIASMTASALADSELFITLQEESSYQSPEHAIVAFAEYSGLGYETVPAFRAVWIRGVNDREDPFERAKSLAINLYENSKDTDLLPRKKASAA